MDTTQKTPDFILKTIDVQSREWWDKINGNTYFASRITLNFGMKDERTIVLPFQYGYGSQDEQETSAELIKIGLFPANARTITHYCRENNIIYRHSKHSNFKKKEVQFWGAK